MHLTAQSPRTTRPRSTTGGEVGATDSARRSPAHFGSPGSGAAVGSGGAAARGWRFGLPLGLTLLRLVLAAAFPWVPTGWRAAAVLAAAASDLLDGRLSRRFGTESAAGRRLDPIADKAFVAAVLVTVLAEGRLAVWQVLLVGLRDLVVVALAVRSLASAPALLRDFRPTPLGKAATAAQFAFLVALFVRPEAATALLWGTAALSGAAAADYLRRGFLSPRPALPQVAGPSSRHATCTGTAGAPIRQRTDEGPTMTPDRLTPDRFTTTTCETGAFDAERLLRLFEAVDRTLPVRLRRLHAVSCDGPAAPCGTAGELLAALRPARGTVAWRDDAGREWVAFEVRVREAAAEILVRSDVGEFCVLPCEVRWE